MRHLLIIGALALVAGTSRSAAASTSVAGNVSGSWNYAGSPYLVAGELTVPGGSTLTIDPGVVVQFDGPYALTVHGRLIADGLPGQWRITFTRHDAADRGRGIRIVNADAAQSVLRNCVIEYQEATYDQDDWQHNQGGGLFIFGANVLVEQSELRNNRASYGGGVYVYGWGMSAVLRRNRIHDNSANLFAGGWAGGAGIYLEQGSAATTITDNLVYANSCDGNAVWSQGGGGILESGGDGVITNNTIWGNSCGTGPGLHVLASAGNQSNMVVANNVVWGNPGGAQPGQVTVSAGTDAGLPLAAGLVLTHNVVGGGISKVYGPTLEGSVAGTATVTIDPLLYDPANGRFELRAGSPAIDSASAAASGYPTTDYYGLGRVDIAAVANSGAGAPTFADRGAIEWSDSDGDTIADQADNCYGIPNLDQRNTDGDQDGDACDADDDNDGFNDAVDCGPTDRTVYPGAQESCDAVDSDCDGDPIDGFANADGDAVPDCADADDDNDGTADAADCAPTNAAIHPGAAEACDLVDSDCNGSLVDGFANTDGDAQPDCVDGDDDGDGAADAADCAPTSAAIHPGAAEACDLVDSDCDGDLIDGFANTDGDGQPDCVDGDDDNDGTADANDCAPTTASIHPGAGEACDLVDSDCDGDLVDGFANADGDAQPDCADPDDDNDGSGDAADCAPTNAAIHPGAAEACDLVDADCDGDLVDGFANADGDAQPDCIDADDDNDGSSDAADCAPTNAAIHPGAVEACDLVDSDCDGDLVDGFPNRDGDARPDCVDDGDGDGDPDATDCAPTDPAIHHGAGETCDNVDADCDGDLVDGFADADGDAEPDCIDADDDGDGFADADDCGPTDAAVHPGAGEACDDVDSDCDGSLTDTFADTDGDGRPDCVDDDDDGDHVLDAGDDCPLVVNPDQLDTDGNGLGDACTDDRDGDGVRDADDDCPLAADHVQRDTDGDHAGDRCDDDDDGDGVADPADDCPLTADPDQRDTDGDATGDACDDDDDGDGLSDPADDCPLAADPLQADGDGDGLGDACDQAAPDYYACSTGGASASAGAPLALVIVLLTAVHPRRRPRRRSTSPQGDRP